MPVVFSTRDAAELYGAKPWQVARIFEQKELPEPPRVAGRRAIPREMLPAILDRLRAHGWAPQSEESAQ